jgi:hypothetical protein
MDKKRNDPENQRQQHAPKHPNEQIERAHKEADKDMAADAELTAHSPNDDLDEEESARLGEKNNGLV